MKLLLFGMLAEDMGAPELEIDMPGTVNAMRIALLEKYPVLKTRQFLIAVNKQKASGDQALKPGDEIALIPPFAGG